MPTGQPATTMPSAECGIPRDAAVCVCVCVCVCMWLGSESVPSQSPFVLSVTAQRAGAGVSRLHHGRRGVAPAPRFQLYVHYVAPCRARGGCRAPVSVSGASMAEGAV